MTVLSRLQRVEMRALFSMDIERSDTPVAGAYRARLAIQVLDSLDAALAQLRTAEENYRTILRENESHLADNLRLRAQVEELRKALRPHEEDAYVKQARRTRAALETVRSEVDLPEHIAEIVGEALAANSGGAG